MVLDQLRDILRQPGNEEGLRALLARSREDLRLCAEADPEALLPGEPTCEQLDWAGTVMQELLERADIQGHSPEVSGTDPRVTEARDIGRAYAGGLVPAIQGTPAEPATYFEELGSVPEPLWWTELDDISVEAAGRSGADLHRHGLSPLTVAVAARGVANGLRRACRLRRLDEGVVLTIRPEPIARPLSPVSVCRTELSIDDLERDVAFVTHLPPPAGRLLAGWLVEVAHHRPALFDGFFCKVEGNSLRLHPAPAHRPLQERWISS